MLLKTLQFKHPRLTTRPDHAVSVLSSTHCGVADLTGQIVDVPYAITANMLIMQLQGTSLQNKCAVPGNMLSETTQQ